VTGNAELARRARQLADAADRGSAERASALCAAVALAETSTIPAARRVLDGFDTTRPAIKAAARQLLDDIGATP
jgi:S-adenosylhomocysteine hydrolase